MAFVIFIFGLLPQSFLTKTVQAQSLEPNLSSTAYERNNIFTQAGYKGQCTWFAWGRTLEKLNITLGSGFTGNAVTWWNGNTSFKSGSEPRANSLAIWRGGSKGCGHVAFVEKVDGSTVYFNEANHGISRAYDGALESLSKDGMINRGSLTLVGYIYLTNDSGSGNTETPTNGFSYPNNAKIQGSFLPIKDINGNLISGRRVDDGDEITVLDVSYSRQLVLVEYPTSNGVRRGYISNSPYIKYYYQSQYNNGSTPETVYDKDNSRLGSLDPREAATPLYRDSSNGMLHVVYNTGKGINTKSGYVKYNGGFSKF